MLFLDMDKVVEWKANDCTKVIVGNFEEAIKTLSHDLVYEENSNKIYILQGLIRAYTDALTVINNIEDEFKREESDESSTS